MWITVLPIVTRDFGSQTPRIPDYLHHDKDVKMMAKRTIEKTNGWTPERRARQAELIRSWRPWERSTGAQTPEGKAKVARNAWRGGRKQKLRDQTRMTNELIRAMMKEERANLQTGER